MGHRFSKSVSSVINHQQSSPSHQNSQNQQQWQLENNQQNLNNQSLLSSPSSIVVCSPGQKLCLESATLTVPTHVAIKAPRPCFIIKIKLTKMEGGGETATTTTSTKVAVNSGGSCSSNDKETAIDNFDVDNNLNSTKPLLNLILTTNIPYNNSLTTATVKNNHHVLIENGNKMVHLNSLNANITSATINSTFAENFTTISSLSLSLPLSSSLVDEKGKNITEHLINLNSSAKASYIQSDLNSSKKNGSSNCSGCNPNISKINFNSNTVSNLNCLGNIKSRNTICNAKIRNPMMCSNSVIEDIHLCQQVKSTAASSLSSTYPTKMRRCKCNFENFNGNSSCDTSNLKSQTSNILLPSTLSPTSFSNNLKVTDANAIQSSMSHEQNQQSIAFCPRADHLIMGETLVALTAFSDHSHHDPIQAIAKYTSGSHNLFVSSINDQPTLISTSSLTLQLLLTPQLVIERIDKLDERTRRLREFKMESGLDPLALTNFLSSGNPWHHVITCPTTSSSSNFGPVIHSQVDYIHYLIPDLERITSSSFYWGKMDRYEAEKLLEGKPEGTFLLRDSAQEEYCFSVTFRKYGRSLHARIEQFNHKFSFDGHDPGVYTADTVTGLLKHYKDPSCVMFFEPMLTIPLHRNFTFSLQQLCRATVVSHITYDGINKLHLPNSLKSYLKEYHYKLRVRVTPLDVPFYTCS